MGSNQGPGMKFNTFVWIGLVVIAGLEVVLTYRHLPTRTLLICLLGLAFTEAGIGLMYFMHLKYESARLFWALVPITIFVLFMMDHIWPDAYRLLHMRLIQ